MTFSEIVTDWKFWSVVISLLALLLSQLPPLHILLRKTKLDLEMNSRIFVTHKIGNPNLQAHLILRNIGGRSIRIKKMMANISRDNQLIMQLPAQTYVQNKNDNQLVLLTSFDLKPEEEWSYTASFLHYFNRSHEKIYQKAEIKLRNEIQQQKNQHGKNYFALAKLQFVEPFNKLFEEKFNWLLGEYTLEVSIETDTPHADITKQYRFTLFESQTESLVSHKEGYSSGAGIIWESPAYVGLWIEVEEKNG